VLITGASRGLGLATAREFGSLGAIVAICARDRAELDRAHRDLSARGVRAHTFVCDITDRNQVQAMVAAAVGRLGPIDLLVNNAGIIKVAPFSEMTVEDFEEAMQVMFWGMLYTTLAVLPGMRARKQGAIVNITSIGGKVSVPHLLPYCCAKFAAVALSEGLRTELAPAGIRVTTIAPGLLRTGSHLNAVFKGRQSREYTWFAAGAATPLVSISAERAARSIVRAAVRGTGEKVLSVPAELAARLVGLAPGLSGELLTLVNRALPAETGGRTAECTGHDVEATMNSRLWKAVTRFGQRAAGELNEIPASV
jgi:NAD(P)-dependent dehydrogenase (short-subunit alcohol dehydrogenase family)